ncbi:hypothetical protein DMC30DRAFT_448066 [Rhodotorula diobovata]|uniref:DnaJ-domain-containing protein n=1 Tax=Rhodotorula diobovata TaxID=5288 RepID=A0A5C5FRK7_9BASI|nr:hypothetical protein DMC30DRAFT_448066 [Rhodotorula diobovata]
MVADTKLYDALGVAPGASDAEIKKAYRKLALRHHPDKQSSTTDGAPADPTRFQEIQHAWEVLSDPDQRADYDEFGEKGSGGGGGGAGDEEMFHDFFAEMFGGVPPGFGGPPPPGGGGGGGRPRQKRKTQTPPSVVDLPLTLEELYTGCAKHLAVERTRTCATCAGSGAKPGRQAKPCVKCSGQGQTFAMKQMGPYIQRVPIRCTLCEGRGLKVRDQDACKKCKGARTVRDKKRVDFHVERGMHFGETIVISGEGDESPDSSAPGDLHITVRPLPHPTFVLVPPRSPSSPSDLSTTLSLTLSESLLGFSRLILVHLDGRGLRVAQPGPGQRGWRVLKGGDEVVVPGEGMWRAGRRGDLVLRVEVAMPDEQWAMGLAERGGVETLRGLLPPRRPDLAKVVVEEGKETDEVELEEKKEQPEEEEQWYHGTGRPYDEDEGAAPGCQQQ